MSRFINTELKSDSDSELDSEAESKSDTELIVKLLCIILPRMSGYIKSDTELMAKLESSFDSA